MLDIHILFGGTDLLAPARLVRLSATIKSAILPVSRY